MKKLITCMLCLVLLGGLCVPSAAAATTGAEVSTAVTAKEKAKIKKLKKRKTTLKVASTTNNSVKLKWTKVAGAKKYIVYCATSKKSKYTKIATVASAKLSYTSKGLKANRKYYFKVRAYAKIGGKTTYSKYSDVKLGKTKVKASASKPAPIASDIKLSSANTHLTPNGLFISGMSLSMYISVSNADTCADTITITETLRTSDYSYAKYNDSASLQKEIGAVMKRTAKVNTRAAIFYPVDIYSTGLNSGKTSAVTYTLSAGGKTCRTSLPMKMASFQTGGSFLDF